MRARNENPEWVVGLRAVLRDSVGSPYRVYPDKGRTKLDIRLEEGSRKFKTLPIPWDRAHSRRIQETVESIKRGIDKGLSINEAIRRTELTDAPKISHQQNPKKILEAWVKFEDYKINTKNLDQRHFNKKFGGEPNDDKKEFPNAKEPKRKKERGAVGQTYLRIKANADAEDANDLLNRVADGMEPGSRYRQQVVRQTAEFLRYVTGTKAGRILDPDKWTPPDRCTEYIGEKKGEDEKKDPPIYLSDDEILKLIESLAVEHQQKSHAVEAKKWQFALQLCATYGLRPVEILHLQVRRGKLWSCYIKRSGGGTGKERELVPFHPEWAEQWDLVNRVKNKEALPNCTAGAGEAMGTYLKRTRENNYWLEIRKNKKVTPYSFRHSYSERVHEVYGMSNKDAADLMGHHEGVHIEVYKEWGIKDTESVMEKAMKHRAFYENQKDK